MLRSLYAEQSFTFHLQTIVYPLMYHLVGPLVDKTKSIHLCRSSEHGRQSIDTPQVFLKLNNKLLLFLDGAESLIVLFL